ncbi:MAG: hypothetical protein LBD75_03585 [Candidatus Peribacteria bacterium]|nr:hypothetical protein [Candidatus Peribacteria bacterium]
MEEIEVEVQIDLNKQKNYLSPLLYEKIQQAEQFLHIELPENTVSLRQLEYHPSDKIEH